MKKDIKEYKDIQIMVDDFYGKVQNDELLRDIFNNVILDRWPEHLEKMYRFWETVLLNNHTYHGSPFMPHAKLPIEKKHFERWLTLFHHTIDDHFSGLKADEAKTRAEKMAQMFQYKIDHINSKDNK